MGLNPTESADMTEDLYKKCWSLLVRHAGASKDPRDAERFVQYCVETRGPLEYRFIGEFGYGGKFRRYDGRLYIDCYPEDLTKRRQKILDHVNRLLAEITPVDLLR